MSEIKYKWKDKVVVNYKEFVDAVGEVYSTEDMFSNGRIMVTGLPNTIKGSYCMIPKRPLEK